jgi:transposase-like protein
MAKKARKFSTKFKLDAVRRMAEATSIVGLAEELGVRRKLLYEWRDRFQAEGSAGLERRVGRPPGSKAQRAPRSVLHQVCRNGNWQSIVGWNMPGKQNRSPMLLH